jgi:hypothetical protein
MRKLRYRLLKIGALLVCIGAFGCATPVGQRSSEPIRVHDQDLDSLFYRGAEVDIVGRRLGSVYGGDYDSYRGAYVASVKDERQLSWNILSVGRTLLTAPGTTRGANLRSLSIRHHWAGRDSCSRAR